MEPMESSDYFESYSGIEVHELMLKDTVRNEAYRKAIFDNKAVFEGKTVLDVGAGTGILSVFCAQAGARKVYAVEASNIYRVAQEIVEENKFQDVIQIINSRVEEVELPEKVDVIISEWMGFYLLHEAMLDSVITARDRFLKENGLIFPESATLYCAPCRVPSMYADWSNVSGVSMSSFAPHLRQKASHKPLTQTLKSQDLLADSEVVAWIDLREITIADLEEFKFEHVAVANRSDKHQGFCLWFTCTFPSYDTEPVVLSTEPEEAETHWKQTVIVLPNEIEIDETAPIAYELNLKRCRTTGSNNSRRYDIVVSMLDPEKVNHPEYCNCYLTKCILVKAMLEKYEKDSLN